MTRRVRKKYIVCIIVVIIVMLLFLGIELKPVQICHSTIFTTPGQTEIKMYVLMNTFLSVDEETLAKEIISEEQQVNGVRENPIYTLKLYRTLIHYRQDFEYDTLVCDENGVIICGE